MISFEKMLTKKIFINPLNLPVMVFPDKYKVAKLNTRKTKYKTQANVITGLKFSKKLKIKSTAAIKTANKINLLKEPNIMENVFNNYVFDFNFISNFHFLFGLIKSLSTAYIPAATPNNESITVNHGFVFSKASNLIPPHTPINIPAKS